MNWSIFFAAAGSASVEFLETTAITSTIAGSGYVYDVVWGTMARLSAVAAIAQYLLKVPKVLMN